VALERLGGGYRNRVWAARVGGLVVTTWLEGDPPAGERDWRLVADELARLHRLTAGRRQRPGFASTQELLARSTGGDYELG
jgi:Ser/Thr protein kinase RdoA (MazF antagonist)